MSNQSESVQRILTTPGENSGLEEPDFHPERAEAALKHAEERSPKFQASMEKSRAAVEVMRKAAMLHNWTVEQLRGETTSATFRNAVSGEWIAKRAELHKEIINRLLIGKKPKNNPELLLVTGGVRSGKSNLIRSKRPPRHLGTVVIDADELWVEIPEYEALAAADWKTAGDRTYAEVRYLEAAALEAARVAGRCGGFCGDTSCGTS